MKQNISSKMRFFAHTFSIRIQWKSLFASLNCCWQPFFQSTEIFPIGPKSLTYKKLFCIKSTDLGVLSHQPDHLFMFDLLGNVINFFLVYCTRTTFRANRNLFILHSQNSVFSGLFEYFKGINRFTESEQKMKSLAFYS